MTKKPIESYMDDDLIERTHKLASDLSYYNAAEGNSWDNEETERYMCRAMFREARDEMAKRGLEFVNKNYLI